MQLGIVIITFNIDIAVFLLQIKAIRLYCKDNYDIQVVDNSNIKRMSDDVQWQCKVNGIEYRKVNSAHGAGTESHAFAANISYQRFFKGQYDHLFYIDHDCIPIKEFSVLSMLGDKMIGGLGQGTISPYFWAGFVFWNDKEIDKNLIDFSPSHELTLDTGGMLYKVVEHYGKEKCLFLGEEYWENPDKIFGIYNFYSILGETFMHFINSSNWNNQENNQARINSLINICTQWMEKNK